MPKYLKVLDRLGNEMRAGCTYHFKTLDCPVTCREVQPEGVIDTKQPGRVILELSIPFARENDKQEAVVFGELMQIVHPQELSKALSIVEAGSSHNAESAADAIAKIRQRR